MRAIDADAGARLEPFALHDLPGVYRVCAEVDARGGDRAQVLTVPELAGHVFAGPYLAYEPTLSWTVSDALGVAGYLVAASDTAAFESWRESRWYPTLRRRHPIDGKASITNDDARYLRFLHAALREQEPGLEGHPASLHIKLAPRVAGRGWGSALVQHLIDELARRGIPGVHLHVAATNVSAIAFYERLGFRELRSHSGTRTMIRETA